MIQRIKKFLKEHYRFALHGPLHWREHDITGVSKLVTREGDVVGVWEYGVGFRKEYPIRDGDFLVDKEIDSTMWFEDE